MVSPHDARATVGATPVIGDHTMSDRTLGYLADWFEATVPRDRRTTALKALELVPGDACFRDTVRRLREMVANDMALGRK